MTGWLLIQGCVTNRRGGQVTLDRIKGLDSAVMKNFMIHSDTVTYATHRI